MNNKRIEKALKWCEENHIRKTEQLSLFAKLVKRKKKLDKKEFKEMCKKAKVEPGSLCKTIFTESLK